MKHTYPSNYNPRTSSQPWYVIQSWNILDRAKPGLIPERLRFLMAGEIAGALCEAFKMGAEQAEAEPKPKPKSASFRLPDCTCLSCHKVMDAAMSVHNDNKPKDGDITVCMYCGHIMAFDADYKLVNLSDEQMREVAGDPRIIEIQRARGEIMKKKP